MMLGSLAEVCCLLRDNLFWVLEIIDFCFLPTARPRDYIDVSIDAADEVIEESGIGCTLFKLDIPV